VNSRLRLADSATRSVWHRRRLWILAPFVVLVLVRLIAGIENQQAAIWILLPIAIVIVTVAWVFLKDSINHRKEGSARQTWPGRVRLRDLQDCRLFSSWSSNIQAGRMTKWAQGWVLGQIGIFDEGIEFAPNRAYLKGGMRQFVIPWAELVLVEIVPQSFALATGGRVPWSGGKEEGRLTSATVYDASSSCLPCSTSFFSMSSLLVS
jgi:hypothetical protein